MIFFGVLQFVWASIQAWEWLIRQCFVQTLRIDQSGNAAAQRITKIASRKGGDLASKNGSVTCLCSSDPSRTGEFLWILADSYLQGLNGCRFSQIPDIGSMWWLSYVATLMSFAYAFIGLGLAIHKTAEKGHADYGTVWGMAHEQQTVSATWNTFNALGSMAFAYSFVGHSPPWPLLTRLTLYTRHAQSWPQVLCCMLSLGVLMNLDAKVQATSRRSHLQGPTSLKCQMLKHSPTYDCYNSWQTSRTSQSQTLLLNFHRLANWPAVHYLDRDHQHHEADSKDQRDSYHEESCPHSYQHHSESHACTNEIAYNKLLITIYFVSFYDRQPFAQPWCLLSWGILQICAHERVDSVEEILQTSFYLCIGCISYAAFGNKSPGNLLTGEKPKGASNPMRFLSVCQGCGLLRSMPMQLYILKSAHPVYNIPSLKYDSDTTFTLLSGFGYFNPYWLVAAANIFVFVWGSWQDQTHEDNLCLHSKSYPGIKNWYASSIQA